MLIHPPQLKNQQNQNPLKANLTPAAKTVAIALSGGGDSVALYHFLRQVMPAENIHVLHFNHNLRATAADDAAFVEELAEKYGSPYHSQIWSEKPTKNLQQAARNARYTFFNTICAQEKINHLYLGHTQDDVQETFFMRLGKGSGLTGLTSLKRVSQRQNLTLHRPLLTAARAELRTFLTDNNHTWQEDPSNENPKFERIQIRQNLPALGLDSTAITSSINALTRAEETLSHLTNQLFNTHWQDQTFPQKILFAQPQELQLRLIGSMLRHYFPHDMLPRTTKRAGALVKLQNQEKTTLGGLILTPKNGQIYTKLEHA